MVVSLSSRQDRPIMKIRIWTVAVLVTLNAATVMAQNTVLDLTTLQPIADNQMIPTDYGSNFPNTPNVATNWGGNRGPWEYYAGGWGDLPDAAWFSHDFSPPPEPPHDIADITLGAAPGFVASLSSFNMARYVSYDDTQNVMTSLTVAVNGVTQWSAPIDPTDGTVHLLTGSTHSSFTFSPPITGQTIDIIYTAVATEAAPGIGSVGINDITFAQATNPTYLPGDVNFDHIVNAQDIALVASNWLNIGLGVPGDANGDRIVNAQDIAEIASHWLNTVGGGAGGSGAAVPEPSTLILSALGGLALLASRRRCSVPLRA
jgi:hypothetical protein